MNVPNPLYQCPSDPNSGGDVPNTNYIGVAGGGVESEAYATADADCCRNRAFFNNGVLFINSAVRIRDLVDGTTNQYLVAETKYQPTPASTSTQYPTWAGTVRAGGGSGGGGNCCTSSVTIGSAIDGINSSNYDPANGFDVAPVMRMFGSRHTGGAHVSFCDGSVHFLSENMDITAYRDLADRGDRLPVGGFAP